jgi:hypothetical protein
METIDYKVTDGSEYLWQCFGDNAYKLGSNGSGYTINITFDTLSQRVYEMEAHDFANHRSYRLIDPDFVQAYRDEAVSKNLRPEEAYDDVDFVTLECDEDILEKAQALVRGETYDTRVQVPITLGDDEIFVLMKLAHEQDITLNELVENMLEQCIRENSIVKPPAKITANKKKGRK